MYGSLRFGLVNGDVKLAPERETTQADAEPIQLPTWIAGRFLRPRQVDWYRLSVKKGDTLWLEAAGERDGKVIEASARVRGHVGSGADVVTELVLSDQSEPRTTVVG